MEPLRTSPSTRSLFQCTSGNTLICQWRSSQPSIRVGVHGKLQKTRAQNGKNLGWITQGQGGWGYFCYTRDRKGEVTYTIQGTVYSLYLHHIYTYLCYSRDRRGEVTYTKQGTRGEVTYTKQETEEMGLLTIYPLLEGNSFQYTNTSSQEFMNVSVCRIFSCHICS